MENNFILKIKCVKMKRRKKQMHSTQYTQTIINIVVMNIKYVTAVAIRATSKSNNNTIRCTTHHKSHTHTHTQLIA